MKKLSTFIMILCICMSQSQANDTNLSFYTGVFDTIDEEGDDQAKLVGLEHRDNNKFRNTFLGKISPITGGFVSDKNSIYLYTCLLYTSPSPRDTA